MNDGDVADVDRTCGRDFDPGVDDQIATVEGRARRQLERGAGGHILKVHRADRGEVDQTGGIERPEVERCPGCCLDAARIDRASADRAASRDRRECVDQQRIEAAVAANGATGRGEHRRITQIDTVVGVDCAEVHVAAGEDEEIIAGIDIASGDRSEACKTD